MGAYSKLLNSKGTMRSIVPYLIKFYFGGNEVSNRDLSEAFWRLMGKNLNAKGHARWTTGKTGVPFRIHQLTKQGVLILAKSSFPLSTSLDYPEYAYSYGLGERAEREIADLVGRIGKGRIDAEIRQFLGRPKASRGMVSAPPDDIATPDTVRLPEEVPASVGRFTEGALRRITVNAYERDTKARQQCIEHHQARCKVCGMSFGEVYGELGEGFIHVHHLVPLHSIGASYQVDPCRDLVPVCPNCHAMLHRKPGSEPYTIEELRSLLKKRG